MSIVYYLRQHRVNEAGLSNQQEVHSSVLCSAATEVFSFHPHPSLSDLDICLKVQGNLSFFRNVQIPLNR